MVHDKINRLMLSSKWKRNCDYELPQQILYRQIRWTTNSFDDTFNKSKRQRKTGQGDCCLVILYDAANEEVVTNTRKGKRERKNEIWEQNLTWTLALLITSFPILCFVPIFKFARSLCSFLVLVTVGRHYDVRGIFFFGGARKSEKKRTPEYRFRIWFWQ